MNNKSFWAMSREETVNQSLHRHLRSLWQFREFWADFITTTIRHEEESYRQRYKEAPLPAKPYWGIQFALPVMVLDSHIKDFICQIRHYENGIKTDRIIETTLEDIERR